MTSLPRPPLGAHTSIAGGVFNAIRIGREIGADVVQIFSKNQMQWQGRWYTEEELAEYFRLIEETGVRPMLIHDAYLINLAGPRQPTLRKSIEAFADELRRAAVLKIPYLLTHPGSHLGEGEAAGIARVAESLRIAREMAGAPEVHILLEVTAGQGTNLGYRFEHLRDIIAQSGMEEILGVCIDTCHIFAAGYDIRTPEAWEATVEEFDRVIGLGKLRAFHLNDSQKPLGSRRDRHARIGQGELGPQAFANVVNDPRVNHLPMVIEIPGGPKVDKEDIALLRSLVENASNPEEERPAPSKSVSRQC